MPCGRRVAVWGHPNSPSRTPARGRNCSGQVVAVSPVIFIAAMNSGVFSWLALKGLDFTTGRKKWLWLSTPFWDPILGGR